ncbi:hypothetical protein C5F51_05115 [Nocardia nova]|uniref:Uncharacterized protein n=1 Tax=Nocardia nova TaxID=37330 RepID=A0A2S6ADU7_9NOCA|nr:hypothetical protein C5F51_05115 [Nocardia nova]
MRRNTYYRPVGDLDLGNGRSLPLYLAPDSFDSAVLGVVLTYDSLTRLLNNLENTVIDGSGLGDSAVAAACADFRSAWETETEITAKAVGIIVDLLPRVKRKYQDADQDAGMGIGGTDPTPSLVPSVTQPSGRPPSG